MTSRRVWVLVPLVVVLVVGSALLVVGPAGARGTRSISLHYHPTGEYDVFVNDKLVEAEVLFSRRAASYVVSLTGETNAVVLRQRSRSVGSVSGASLTRRADGFVELAPTAAVQTLGRFQLAGSDVIFSLSDRRVRLKPRPPLLKQQTSAGLLAHSPQYAMRMRRYRPAENVLASLKSVSHKATVEVFFGSWCSRCQRLLGRVLRLEKALGESQITFKYYGLPNPPAAWQEPRYRAAGIRGLPSAVVSVNGRVRGRLSHSAWPSLEYSLLQLVQ